MITELKKGSHTRIWPILGPGQDVVKVKSECFAVGQIEVRSWLCFLVYMGHEESYFSSASFTFLIAKWGQ